MIKRTLLATLLSVPFLVSAKTYTVIDTTQSQIQFHYEQMGVSMDGVFTGISGQIDFDTTAPESAKATLDVKMTSVDTGSDEADGEIIKAEWFNVSSYPKATFITTEITKTADNSFDVTGMLSIKGHEQEVRFPVTFTESDNTATFAGSFSLLRGDYAIGEGSWSTFDIVANDIRVDFNLVATN